MPLMSGLAFRRVPSCEAAASDSHLAGISSTFSLGKFFFTQARKASERSRPLTEARSPMICTTLPEGICSPRYWQAFSPYETLFARTTMATLPLSGATSTATTGTPLRSAWSRPASMAALSSGATTRPLTPWLSSLLMSVICWEGSLLELTVFSVSTPSDLAILGT